MAILGRMAKTIQFSLCNAMIATTWLAILCADLALSWQLKEQWNR
jgi:hypothetical protein